MAGERRGSSKKSADSTARSAADSGESQPRTGTSRGRRDQVRPDEKRGPRPPLTLATELTYLKGAGPAVAQRLATLGLKQVRDLLFHLPLRYEDRRSPTPLANLKVGEEALILARIVSAEVQIRHRRALRVVVEQEGVSLVLRFFHFNEAQKNNLISGYWLRGFGTARQGAQGLEMVHPEYRVAEQQADLPMGEGLLAVYPTTQGITQARLRSLVAQALSAANGDADLKRTLPDFPVSAGKLDTLSALQALHQPADLQAIKAIEAHAHPAQQRLIREELLAHQLGMRSARRRARATRAPALASVQAAVAELSPQLGFPLTNAQQRVIAEIGSDLEHDQPMLRLVQGDVGSGKTAVAAVALVACARAGYQAALMAPTELLAEQHAATLSRWLAPLGLKVAFFASKLDRTRRNRALAELASHEAHIAVGTHALFQSDVRFARLGLIAVDEQHRFGVGQRLSLREKGAAASDSPSVVDQGGSQQPIQQQLVPHQLVPHQLVPHQLVPHQLVLSATPIPRTLAQTLYADLDVSQIDELPPGRTPVQTVVLNSQRRAEVLSRIGAACAQGRQVYWVCTLIEESEQLEAQAAEVTFQTLREELPGIQVGLVHGRLKPAEKENVMRAFKDGRVQLLVATTVIEVGVDVPNASIMVIEDAQRLGLSQLHQLRGRVGRGAQASQCVLLYQHPLSDNGKARLETMRQTNDGFEIARRDLELRGPGELLGRRQTGDVGLKLADPLRDAELIPNLQILADQWLDRNEPAARCLIERWIGVGERYADV